MAVGRRGSINKHGLTWGKHFDCTTHIKTGDIISYKPDKTDEDIYSGKGRAKKVYPYFVILDGNHTDITVNRWDIISVNGKKVTAGYFKVLEVNES